jgi:RNA recognition motif-containing protein
MATKLFVGNLSEETTTKDLKTLFSAVGTVLRARIAMDSETGERKGFGYVEMETQQEANAAIQRINGERLNDRVLKVREARPSSSPPATRGPRRIK